jgi:hypothetical protein
MLTPAAILGATGLALQAGPNPMGHESDSGEFGVVTIKQFADTSGNKLTVTLTGAVPLNSGIFKVAAKFATRGGVAVEGLGDSAHWMGDRALVLDSKGQMLSIDADFPHSTPAQRLEAARNVARLVLSSPQA